MPDASSLQDTIRIPGFNIAVAELIDVLHEECRASRHRDDINEIIAREALHYVSVRGKHDKADIAFTRLRIAVGYARRRAA